MKKAPDLAIIAWSEAFLPGQGLKNQISSHESEYRVSPIMTLYVFA